MITQALRERAKQMVREDVSMAVLPEVVLREE
jgi:hypothetical protein